MASPDVPKPAGFDPGPIGRLSWGMRLSRLLKPGQWGLSARFLASTGALLCGGCLVLGWIFYYYQSIILHESVHNRLSVFQNWMMDKIRGEIDGQFGDAAPLAAMRDVVEAMRRRDREGLKAFILPYLDHIKSTTGRGSLYFHFHLPPAVSFLRTWDLEDTGSDLSLTRPMVVMANKYQASFKGIEVGPGGASIRAIVPISDQKGHLGSVEAATSIENILQMTNIPAQFGLVFLLDAHYVGALSQNQQRPVHGYWMLGRVRGTIDEQALVNSLEAGVVPARLGNTYFQYVKLDDFQNRPIGGLLLSFDSWPQLKSTLAEAAIFALAFSCGAMFVWFVIYVNVKRVKRFLRRLGQMLVATNDGDFSQRFETDAVHCLEMLKCGNTACPVHRDPSLICYLEAGSEAISPRHRNTCIYLRTYRRCRYCPVYALRHGDELVEMRNALNTMMRIWRGFTLQVNEVVSGVLHTRAGQDSTPPLTAIGAMLEDVAGLTSFTHDLQGAFTKFEVYDMLEGIFARQFGLTRYLILEVASRENTFTVALNKLGSDQKLCSEVFYNPDLCRAKRMGEEATSRPNPALCPYFHVDRQTEVRCCLPLVMGGRVGGVFSFVFPATQWEERRDSLPVLHKYLAEAAPVLTSLELLALSKEQSLRDPLTGLHNRRFLDEYLGRAEAEAKRDGARVGFIMADLDYFKQVNDVYGHLAGDAVLKDVAGVLVGAVREADLVVRFGGEEFLILLHDVREGFVAGVAEKVRLAVEGHEFVLPDGQRIKKTLSLGLAEYPSDADQLYKAIKFADVALYRAKETGRNRAVRFTADMWRGEAY